MNLTDIINTPQVHILPLQYTQYQRTLLHILGRLHAEHILNVLSNKPTTPKDDEMSDDAMFDTFVYNSKQVINHPTMIVDHYMPKNLLLLNPKQNIATQSQKYHYLNELLDHLSDSNISKTMVISVTNSKEMDLLESILIGRNQLQYYRFSGSSLYYEKNGMFDLINKPIQPIPDLKKQSSSPERSTPKSRSRTSASPASRGRGRGRPRGRGGRVGRPATKAAHLLNGDQSNSSSDTNANIKSNTRDDYIPKISKNNPIKKRNNTPMNLKVYLILSKQLKYLPKLEELNLDLLVSLDSNCIDFDAVANTMGKVPILKPLVLNSIEHYEWKLRNKGVQDPEMNKILTYLTIASYPSTKINDFPTFEEFVPLNAELVKWIIDGCSSDKFPYPSSYETCVPIKIDKTLEDSVKSVLSAYKDLSSLISTIKDPKFTFYNKETNENVIKSEDVEMEDVKIKVKSNFKQDQTDDAHSLNGNTSHKKPKLNPKPLDQIPANLSYRQYQSLLTMQLIQVMDLMKNWTFDTKSLLADMHLSETNRQLYIDETVVGMGELYKKDRDLGVLIEARNKIKEKSKSEYERVDKILNNTDVIKGIQNRVENIDKLSNEGINESLLTSIDSDIANLNSQINKLNIDIDSVNNDNEVSRQRYQESSSSAADMSLQEKMHKTNVEAMEKQAKGDFIKLKENALQDKAKWYRTKLDSISRENEFLKKYLSILESVQEKKQKTSTRNRSRTNNPN